MKISYLELLQRIKEGNAPDKVLYGSRLYTFNGLNYVCAAVDKTPNKYLYYNIFLLTDDKSAVDELVEVLDGDRTYIVEINVPIIERLENQRIVSDEQKINEVIRAVNRLIDKERK